MIENNFSLSPQQAAGSVYQRAMRDEIATWGAMDLEALKTSAINHPMLLAYKARILGGRSSTTDYADWTDFLLEAYGPRQSCFSLGAGMGRVENHLIRIGFAKAFNAVELSQQAVNQSRRHAPGLDSIAGDLNFIELPERQFDFILCHGVMHHLINQEHVFDQINRALTDDGIFLLYEYIGPDRWQFDDLVMRLLSQAFPADRLRCPKPWQIGGFESIRSSAIMGIADAVFGESTQRQVLYGGAYFPYVTCARPSRDASMPAVIELDERASANGLLPACYVMRIAGKSSARAPAARRWSDEELATRLFPAVPASERLRRGLRDSPLGPALRRIRRFVS